MRFKRACFTKRYFSLELTLAALVSSDRIFLRWFSLILSHLRSLFNLATLSCKKSLEVDSINCSFFLKVTHIKSFFSFYSLFPQSFLFAIVSNRHKSFSDSSLLILHKTTLCNNLCISYNYNRISVFIWIFMNKLIFACFLRGKNKELYLWDECLLSKFNLIFVSPLFLSRYLCSAMAHSLLYIFLLLSQILVSHAEY